MIVAVCLNALLTFIGVATGYFVSVVAQGASAGQFVANLTLLTGLSFVVLFVINNLITGITLQGGLG